MTEEENNHYFEVAKEIIDRYFEEKKLLKECMQTERTTATTEKVLKTVFSQMTEQSQKIYDAWEDEWVKSKYFPNHEERSLAAAFKELINQLQRGTTIGPVIMCPDILELCEELEND